jgi:hypothetical protein
MSLSVNPATAQTYLSADGGATGTSSTSETSGTAATSGSTAASTPVDAPASSTVVTLSPDAQALSAFAAAGITFAVVSFASMGISASDFANASTPAQQLALMQRISQALPHPGAAVSKSNFEQFAAQFGGTKTQADQLFKDLDTNGDGAISNAEFLSALGNLSKDGSSPVAQLLLGMMNTNGSGSVSFSQFSSFETAFVQAEDGQV